MEVGAYFSRIQTALDLVAPAEVDALVDRLYDAYERGATVFIAGNGGSAANASHLAQDLSKGTLQSREDAKRLECVSLCDNVAWLTALANDIGYEAIFSEQLKTFGREGDLFVAISGSGNSANILEAVEYANANEIHTIGLTGHDGGQLRLIAGQSVHVPVMDMGVVESVHAAIFHYIVVETAERMQTAQAYA